MNETLTKHSKAIQYGLGTFEEKVEGFYEIKESEIEFVITAPSDFNTFKNMQNFHLSVNCYQNKNYYCKFFNCRVRDNSKTWTKYDCQSALIGMKEKDQIYFKQAQFCIFGFQYHLPKMTSLNADDYEIDCSYIDQTNEVCVIIKYKTPVSISTIYNHVRNICRFYALIDFNYIKHSDFIILDDDCYYYIQHQELKIKPAMAKDGNQKYDSLKSILNENISEEELSQFLEVFLRQIDEDFLFRDLVDMFFWKARQGSDNDLFSEIFFQAAILDRVTLEKFTYKDFREDKTINKLIENFGKNKVVDDKNKKFKFFARIHLQVTELFSKYKILFENYKTFGIKRSMTEADFQQIQDVIDGKLKKIDEAISREYAFSEDSLNDIIDDIAKYRNAIGHLDINNKSHSLANIEKKMIAVVSALGFINHLLVLDMIDLKESMLKRNAGLNWIYHRELIENISD